MHTNPDNPASSVLKDICGDQIKDLSHVPAIKFGSENEDRVREMYANQIFQTPHTGQVTVKKSGLQVCEDYPHLAASPDGLVTCTCCEPGLVEIKCLFKFRDNSISEMQSQTDILDALQHLPIP